MCGDHGIHPSVPRSAVMLWVNYCHACRAWELTVYAHDQTGEDTGDMWFYRDVNFGPFDSWQDVRDVGEQLLDEVLDHEDGPWHDEHSSWRPVDTEHPAAGGPA